MIFSYFSRVVVQKCINAMLNAILIGIVQFIVLRTILYHTTDSLIVRDGKGHDSN